jgi:hypothetical protein
VYLCGTKYDLVEENKKLRKVEYSTVKEYADGKNTGPEEEPCLLHASEQEAEVILLERRLASSSVL